jgi:hypothetical protein
MNIKQTKKELLAMNEVTREKNMKIKVLENQI